MLFKQLAPQLAGITAVLATPLNLRRNEHSSYGTIEWGPCAFNGTLPILCGKLAVPVDYSDSSSSKTVDLNLVKVPAIISPSRGTIQLNFGGPGLEAIHTLANLAGELQRYPPSQCFGNNLS